MRRTHLQAIGTALPPHSGSQDDVVGFMRRVCEASLEHSSAREAEYEGRKLARTIEQIYDRSGIRRRYSVVEDFAREPREFSFFPPNWRLEPFPTTRRRMELYRSEAPSLARSAAERCLAAATHLPRESITHLVVVGPSAPNTVCGTTRLTYAQRLDAALAMSPATPTLPAAGS